MQPEIPKKRGQLRDTFILLFIVISCVPILVLGTVSLYSISNTHKKNVSELEKQTLIVSEEIINAFFNEIIDTISTKFDSLDQSNLQGSDVNWQQIYAEKFLQSNSAFSQISFVSNEGKEVAKYSKFSKSGILLNVSDSAMFKSAILGKVTISDVHSTLRGQTVTVTAPLFVDGKIFNVVIAEVSLTPLISSIEKVRLQNKGYILLFDKNGTLISSKNNSSNTQHKYISWSRLSTTLQGASLDALSPDDVYVSPVTSLPVVGSTRLIPDINWVIFVEWPLSESGLLVENFRHTILISIFISIVAVLIVASYFAYRLVRPIRLLQNATKEIERGNFENNVVITTNNELEELGDSFNTMATGLKRLEELKNEFVYVAAHELRAPVTAIKGYMELIFDGSGGSITPEMEHLLSPVRKSNDRLVNLVNDLLKVARSEAGKLEIEISPADIRKEITAIIDESRPLALKRNVTINYTPQEDLPLAMINIGSFKEVIMNFISNAIKYGNDNGIINITHEVTDGMLSTSVSDNGRGISEEDLGHLFQKFFRAPDVKSTEIEGTGLGLFITKELIEKMGGTLSVTSKIGEGTSFKVSFKIAKGPIILANSAN
ncbi:sensor histidine kinase [Candidatus Gracilibacteria bacterium]|nr:sensor histidine kinase [Candidatus Gracilibacteria bacterium]